MNVVSSILMGVTASAIIVLAGCKTQPPVEFTTTQVTFDNPAHTTFVVDIADSEAEHILGLGDTEVLSEGRGMLFVYPKAAQYRYWMRNVEYPIDIIWLKDSVVVDITANIPPEAPGTPLERYAVYSPKTPANAVLEVGAGVAEAENIAIGQHMSGYLTIEP